MFRTILISSTALAMMSGSALASPPAPIFTWTGFYAGVNAGISGANSTQDLFFAPLFGATPYETLGGSGWGFSGGGQAGYNYQFPNSNFVIGVETDFQGSTAQSKYLDLNFNGGAFFSESEKDQTNLDWWGTARARFGYAFGNILPYVTGGFAYGHTTESVSISAGGLGSLGSVVSDGIRAGWTAGGGVEYALSDNLTLKVEGLYTDLGTATSNDIFGGIGFVGPGFSGSTKFTFSTIRAGLNWKFGDFASPGQANPWALPDITLMSFVPDAPIGFSWTGPYIGANAGLAAGNSDEANFESFFFPTTPYITIGGSGWGFSGGGQIGYNYQFPASHFVGGVETDFQGSTLQSKYANESSILVGPGAVLQTQTSLDWWGSARGRFGYAFGTILPYVTGGFAYGHTTDSGFVVEPGAAGSISAGDMRVGWTAGLGVEDALTNNLTLKVEGLYTDLGQVTINNDEEGLVSLPGFWVKTKFAFSTVRAGLNWKVDWLSPH
ncbi:MAG: outer membrane beta-barrel protein [Methylovirgula sp.]|jgi:outer membrane immunogenic protein